MKLQDTEWYKTRPEVIRKAINIWTPGSNYLVNDEIHYLVGWSETDESDISNDPHDVSLILSKIDPCEDYEGAIKSRIYMCARHFRKEMIQ